MSAPASVVELLQALVRIPSVNPAGHPGTPLVGEARCAEYLADWLRQLGAEFSLREVLPDRPNIVARFPSDRPGKPRLLFAPHTDTVSVAGMTIDPFGGEVRDGKIWGRGASDTKGSMAAMLWAFREARADLAGLSHEIWFAGLAGEEAGQQGAIALAAEEPFAFVIAGEPTGMDVVHLHKGSTKLHLRASGKSAHASRPELGENAIYKIAEAVQWIREVLEPELAGCTHPTLGAPTVSVGTIHGGSKTNIVPDSCEATVDLRTVPGAAMAALLADLRPRLQARVPGLEIEATHSDPLHTDPAHPLIRTLQSLGAQPIGAPWFCDAAVFARAGVPAIALGPGSIAQAHTEDEWLAIEDLEQGAAFFTKFLRALGPGQPLATDGLPA